MEERGMILSFNPERIDSNYVKLIQAPFEFFTIEETIEEKEDRENKEKLIIDCEKNN